MEFLLQNLNTSIIVIAITFYIVFHYLSRHNKSQNQKSPPEAGGAWPILGHLHIFSGSSLPHIVLGDMADKYGPVFTIRIGAHKVLVVSDRKLAKELSTVHDVHISSRPRFRAAKNMGYNYIMFGFSPYGPYWREIRKLTSLELLSHRRLEQLRHIRLLNCVDLLLLPFLLPRICLTLPLNGLVLPQNGLIVPHDGLIVPHHLLVLQIHPPVEGIHRMCVQLDLKGPHGCPIVHWWIVRILRGYILPPLNHWLLLRLLSWRSRHVSNPSDVTPTEMSIIEWLHRGYDLLACQLSLLHKWKRSNLYTLWRFLVRPPNVRLSKSFIILSDGMKKALIFGLKLGWNLKNLLGGILGVYFVRGNEEEREGFGLKPLVSSSDFALGDPSDALRTRVLEASGIIDLLSGKAETSDAGRTRASDLASDFRLSEVSFGL
nr:cytochrome P450 CYP82D47-like [Ipomoea trifida]